MHSYALAAQYLAATRGQQGATGAATGGATGGAARRMPRLAPIQVIHLPRHAKREPVWRRLRDSGAAEWSDAVVDASTMDVASDPRIPPSIKWRILDKQPRHHDDEVNSVGPIACALSHIGTIRAGAAKYLDTGAADVLIVAEDDVNLDETLGAEGTDALLRTKIPELVAALEEADPEWDVLCMYCMWRHEVPEDDPANRLPPRHPLLVQLNRNISNAFHVWSPRGAAKVHQLVPVTAHLDWTLSHMAAIGQLRMYGPRNKGVGKLPYFTIRSIFTGSTLGHTGVRHCLPLDRHVSYTLLAAIGVGLLLLIVLAVRYRRSLASCRIDRRACREACPLR